MRGVGTFTRQDPHQYAESWTATYNLPHLTARRFQIWRLSSDCLPLLGIAQCYAMIYSQGHT